MFDEKGEIMPVVNLSIRGHHPLPYANQEMRWREVIANTAQLWRDQHTVPAGVNRNTIFIVRCVFFILANGIPRADLDNLAKPILDTLFRVDNPQVNDMALTGAMFDVDDRGVCHLNLEKRNVGTPENEGVDIKISWKE